MLGLLVSLIAIAVLIFWSRQTIQQAAPSKRRSQHQQSKRTDVPPELPHNAIQLGGGGDGFIEVVGESHYQEQIRRAKRAATSFGDYSQFLAGLEPEPTNEHDANAVRVHFRGETIGYLCKADAKRFLKTHKEAIDSNRPIYCRARPIGGTSGKPTLGVLLDFMLFSEKRLKRGLDATKRGKKPQTNPSE